MNWMRLPSGSRTYKERAPSRWVLGSLSSATPRARRCAAHASTSAAALSMIPKWSSAPPFPGRRIAVEREVVGAAGEIDVALVRAPLDSVAEDARVKSLHRGEVRDLERDVTDAERFRGLSRHESAHFTIINLLCPRLSPPS